MYHLHTHDGIADFVLYMDILCARLLTYCKYRLSCCWMYRDCRETELEANALDDEKAEKLWNQSLQLCSMIPVAEW